MTDAELDRKLRAMSMELAESSPIAPTFEELHERAGVVVTRVEVMFDQRPDDNPRRPRFWQKTMGVLGLGVAVGGGAFALAALTEDDGATTPQAAVEEFIEAVAAEDVIGVGETLVPSERDLVLDHLDPILAELQRLDVADADADARDVSGLDFTADLDSLRIQESPLTDAVTRVRILDGALGLDADLDGLPVGSAVRDSEGPLENPDPVDLLVDVFGGQADVVTVKGSDGWHVSVFYTLAEYLRAAEGLPSAGLGERPVPIGAESPEALIAAVIDRTVAGDFARLLTLADPVEAAVLYDYWPVFAPEWADSTASALADGPWADVRSYETAVTGDGSERVVSLTAWDYAYGFGTTADDGSRSSFDGACFATTYGSGSDGLDAGDERFPAAEGCLGEPIEFDGEMVMPLRSGLAEISVVERDGRWYVRPGATLIESWLANTAFIDAESMSPLGLLIRAYPSPPTWGAGVDPLGFRMTTFEESGEAVATSAPEPVALPECDRSLDDTAMAGCLSELFGDVVSAADVQACRPVLDEVVASGDPERSWEFEGCITDILYPPTPRDLFLRELATCPGGADPGAAEATPEEQEALIDCARAVFEGDNLPEEILTGMAACLGVEPDALASVTDNQALIACGVEVIAGPPPDQED